MITVALDLSLRILAAAAAVGLVLVLLRVRSGAARHAAWSAVLLAMLTMPVLMAVVPTVDVPVPASLALDFSAGDEGESESLPGISAAPSFEGAAFDASTTASSPVLDGTPVAAPAAPPWRTRLGSLSPILFMAYLAGLLFFTIRMAGGWYFARRLLAGATRVEVANASPVFESSAVATPLTTGIFSPAVVLPDGWREWPADKLAAVLAHENAHVSRRDALVAFLAHANRALFWFHPLAWWLERTLAVTAEHACDEAAARAVGQPRRYAEVLLDMAEAVRQRGQRVSWGTIGVDGSGVLGARMDRILNGDALARMSGVQRAGVAVGCAGVLVLAVACRQQIAAEPLRPDPQIQKQIDENNARMARHRAAVAMSFEEAAALGNRRQAVDHMRAAVEAPISDAARYTPHNGLRPRLAEYLLRAGERDSVAEYLEKSAERHLTDREQLLRDLAQVRAGVMPVSFQFAEARR